MEIPLIIKTPEQIMARLEEFGREILATSANAGDADANSIIDELLGTLFSCVYETAHEIGRVHA